jgi:hypothetical protein
MHEIFCPGSTSTTSETWKGESDMAASNRGAASACVRAVHNARDGRRLLERRGVPANEILQFRSRQSNPFVSSLLLATNGTPHTFAASMPKKAAKKKSGGAKKASAPKDGIFPEFVSLASLAKVPVAAIAGTTVIF